MISDLLMIKSRSVFIPVVLLSKQMSVFLHSSANDVIQMLCIIQCNVM